MQSNMELGDPLTSFAYNLKNCKENIDIDSIYNMYYLATLPKAWEWEIWLFSPLLFVDLGGFLLLLELCMEKFTMNNLATILFQSPKNVHVISKFHGQI